MTNSSLTHAARTLVLASIFLGGAGTAQAALVANWTFDGDFTDASGNGYTGTAEAGGTDTFGTGALGQSYIINETTDSVSYSGSTGLPVRTGPWTISFWGKFDGSSFGSGDGLAGLTSSGSGWGFQVRTDLDIGYWGGGANDKDTNIDPFTDSAWHMYTFVKSGSATAMYLDGNAAASFSTSWTPSAANGIYAGNYTSSTWTGEIDDLSVWTNALTTAERRGMYNFQAAGLAYNATDLSGLYAWSSGLRSVGDTYLLGIYRWTWTNGNLTNDGDLVNNLGSYSFDAGSNILLTGKEIPEPSSLALMGLGGLCLLHRRRA